MVYVKLIKYWPPCYGHNIFLDATGVGISPGRCCNGGSLIFSSPVPPLGRNILYVAQLRLNILSTSQLGHDMLSVQYHT